MGDEIDLDEQFDRFQKSAHAVSVLFGQLFAVLGAALFCREWWHFAVLLLVCVMANPVWAGMYNAALEKWWKDKDRVHNIHMTGETAEETVAMLDAIEDDAPTIQPHQISRSWPFDTGLNKK